MSRLHPVAISIGVILFGAAIVWCGIYFWRATRPSGAVEVLEYGIFRKIVSRDVRSPDTISGTGHDVPEVVLLECTTNIPARIGTSFGFRVKVPTHSSEGTDAYAAKCIHPRLTDPSSGRSGEIDRWDAPGFAGNVGYVGYTLDHDWELVPGSWTIQLFVGSKLVAEKTFHVYVKPST